MEINLVVKLRIEGKCSEKKVRREILNWFSPLSWKISPDEADDDYQVWIEQIRVKEA
jgi:hypothetical protein